MGLNCSFVLVEGSSAEEVLQAAGLAGTGELLLGEDAVTDRRSSGGAVDLDSGWTVVADPRGVVSEDALAQLSLTGRVFVLFLVEHVMGSGADCWQDGRQRWSVQYESGDAPTVTGSPPGYEQLAEAASRADPALGDAVFDVPAQLVARETGWAWDTMDTRLWDEPVWLPLAPPPPPPVRRRWWSRGR